LNLVLLGIFVSIGHWCVSQVRVQFGVHVATLGDELVFEMKIGKVKQNKSGQSKKKRLNKLLFKTLIVSVLSYRLLPCLTWLEQFQGLFLAHIQHITNFIHIYSLFLIRYVCISVALITLYVSLTAIMKQKQCFLPWE